MGKALYRKYRPKSLDEAVGQEHITATLSHALKTGKLAHAYLFTGPRGTGKTSIARILAHEINGIPYEDDSMHLDIIEIDAASNRRIDEIRELRDKVNLAPSSAKYKVYIIDEVHMLTREAFNALLKTLEEPPEHVVFILATTESHKLPETIVSRTQRFMFKPVDQAKVTQHLKNIAKSEDIRIDDDALALVAGYGEGSFRDSISLLDQTRGAPGTVTADFVRSLIGQPPDEVIQAIQSHLASHNAASLIAQLSGLRQQGFAAPQVAKRLGLRLRQDALDNKHSKSAFELMQKLLQVPAAYEPENFLEIILLEQALAVQPAAAAAVTAPLPGPAPAHMPKSETKTTGAHTAEVTQPEPVRTPKKESVSEIPGDQQPQMTHAPAVTEAAPQKTMTAAVPLNEASWPQVLERLKKSHNTLYGIARITRPVFHADHLELYSKFAFHQRRLNEAKNRTIILQAIMEATGQNVAIKCLIEERPSEESTETDGTTTNPAATPVAGGNPLSDISAVFGGAEVLDA